MPETASLSMTPVILPDPNKTDSNIRVRMETEMALTHDGQRGLSCLDNASVSDSCLHCPQPLPSAGSFLLPGCPLLPSVAH